MWHSMMLDDSTLRSLQEAELGILKDIDALCRRHNIEYFLDSGTALGAVRHEGFIPWDDDIDLGMLREEYERFLPVAKEELGDHYVVVGSGELPGFAPLFAKIWKKGTRFYTQETIDAGLDQGVFVDIFVYDRLHADPEVAKRQIKICTRWQRISYLYHSKSINVPHKGALGALESFACVLAHYVVRLLFSPKRIVSSFQGAVQQGLENPGEGYVTMSYPVDPPFERSVLVPSVPRRFEDADFPCPNQADVYLTRIYGSDWMELPPESERRNHAPVELDLGIDSAVGADGRE